jgi:hypothetical protein
MQEKYANLAPTVHIFVLALEECLAKTTWSEL